MPIFTNQNCEQAEARFVPEKNSAQAKRGSLFSGTVPAGSLFLQIDKEKFNIPPTSTFFP